MAIDLDIKRLETSISHLQEPLTSLAEIIKQNKTGLDLIFPQQGRLCIALGEEYSFYFIDHSGVVKEPMTNVSEGLAQQKRD